MAVFKILGIAGSLREGSYNRKALKAAQELLPNEVGMEIADIGAVPLFSEDLEKDPSTGVIVFREKISTADALLIATPEYNYSFPGVLKNALDWGSRPYGKGALLGKPVAIMGASIGALGTARAQYQLRQFFVAMNMPVVNQPEVMIPFADKAFDAKGALVDQTARAKIASLVAALVDLARKK